YTTGLYDISVAVCQELFGLTETSVSAGEWLGSPHGRVARRVQNVRPLGLAPLVHDLAAEDGQVDLRLLDAGRRNAEEVLVEQHEIGVLAGRDGLGLRLHERRVGVLQRVR